MARRRKRSRTRKEGNHRQAPRPSTWDCPRGTCRFCGEDIIEDGKHNKRKHWHQACADTWRIANNPTEARKHVYAREKGVCQDCGEPTPMKKFHVDHIVPLFEASGDIHFYTEKNMQLLCHDCHGVKTKTDMIRFRELKGS